MIPERFRGLDRAEQAMLILLGACKGCGARPGGAFDIVHHANDCKHRPRYDVKDLQSLIYGHDSDT